MHLALQPRLEATARPAAARAALRPAAAAGLLQQRTAAAGATAAAAARKVNSVLCQCTPSVLLWPEPPDLIPNVCLLCRCAAQCAPAGARSWLSRPAGRRRLVQATAASPHRQLPTFKLPCWMAYTRPAAAWARRSAWEAAWASCRSGGAGWHERLLAAQPLFAARHCSTLPPPTRPAGGAGAAAAWRQDGRANQVPARCRGYGGAAGSMCARHVWQGHGGR